MLGWRFAIDVGGTFTDVLAHDPNGQEHVVKILSSGRIRGTVGIGSTRRSVHDPARAASRADLWAGFTLHLSGSSQAFSTVIASDPDGTLHLGQPLHGVAPGVDYELWSGQPAPIVAIRQIMGLRVDEPIGAVDVRLGSTWGTNALLERRGASTAFVTTEGFGDLLLIGYQDRPRLFDLNIRKPQPLFEHVVEVAERLSADGSVLRPIDPAAVEAQLRAVRLAGTRTLAICLLHACVNDAHERAVAEIAHRVGFEHVSVSSSVAPVRRIVPRGDTTVVDAYLAPTIQAYVRELRRHLPEARLRLMTSAGGLVTADAFSAKDSVLSGPAGGVVGCAAIAKDAGLRRVIGFDMGGTSTDVSRCDGPFEYQYEAEKAGVRIVAPMLAIETVAAGGGSICRFDGQKLTVGPDSAGADPGPACYGRGGPLALTDVNLFLGRIHAAHFPFPLDGSIVERQLDELARLVTRETGRPLSAIGLAEGFVAIANAHMAAAIRKISIARGYDVRDYALVSFGGAGGQHACAVASLLGISRVLIGPHAGILSAVGIGHAHVTRQAERPLSSTAAREGGMAKRQRGHERAGSIRHARAALGHATHALGYATLGLGHATRLHDELESQLRRDLAAEGFTDETTECIRSFDIRYVGQDTTINIRLDATDDYVAAFHAAHERAYGYRPAALDVEIVTARVEAIGRTESPARQTVACAPRRPESAQHHPVVIDGVRRPTPLFMRGQLTGGDELDGPAIVVDSFGTIVIEPGWTARVTERLDVLLECGRRAVPSTVAAADTAPDPIRLELFHQRFASIAEQMGATLRRTALSTNVKERLDFSCAVFDANGSLVANAPHIPVHLGGMGACVRRMIERFGPLSPGDVVITNDPFEGGSHLPDVTVVTPVHVSHDPVPRFYTASRAHHAEIGGKRPGSMAADATSLAEEGVLIRPFKLIEAGVAHMDELEDLLTQAAYPSRQPRENLADVTAQVAANRRGGLLVEDLAAEHGVDVVAAYMRHIRDASAQRVRHALKRFAPGTYRRRETLDDGTAIAVTIEMNPDGAVFDFSGSGPVHAGNLNANPSIVTSAVMYCLRCLLAEDIPLNDGVLEPIRQVIPPGILNPVADAAHAADLKCLPAVGGGNVETSQRIVDAIFGALGVVAASQGTMNNLLIGTPQFGYYETIAGGAGAGPDFDGADAVHTHMTNTRLTDPEVFESRYPLRLHRFAIHRGSGGVGRQRGGDGVIRHIEFLAPAEVSILSQRRTTQPYGLAGGSPGASGRNALIRADGIDIALPPIAHFHAARGDQLIIETPGGGGFGRSDARPSHADTQGT